MNIDDIARLAESLAGVRRSTQEGQFPRTFSVPTRYIKHMMVVADIASGDRGAVEDALEAAWEFQRSAG